MAFYLEKEIFPSLRAEGAEYLCLMSSSESENRAGDGLAGIAGKRRFEFPKMQLVTRRFREMGILEILLDTRLEYGQILECFLMLFYVHGMLSSVRSGKSDYSGWNRKHLASQMLGEAGLHRACAVMRFDVANGSYRVDYSYCELFWSRLVKQYSAGQPIFRDHRALFRAAPKMAALTFLAFITPCAFLVGSLTSPAFFVWLGMAAAAAIGSWCYMYAIGAVLYTREHYEELVSEYLGRVRSLARFPESNPNPMMEVTADGTVSFINPAARELLVSLDPSASDLSLLLPQGYVALIRECIEEGRSVRQTEAVLGDRVFLFTCSPFPEGRSAVVSASDVTHLKHIEEELRRTNKELAETNEEVARAYAEVDRELDVIARIQSALLPEALPAIPRADIAARCDMAKKAGGDYYDFFALDGERWGFLIADVSGHGASASVLMAITHCLARLCHKNRASLTPAKLLTFLNRELHGGYTQRRVAFVTAFYGVYDPHKGAFTYSSAGHNPPRLVTKRGTVESLEQAAGLPLGVSQDALYEEAHIELRSDDTVLFYTDGITEAMSPTGELFGVERIDPLLLHSKNDAEAIVEGICEELRRFADGHPTDDDRTMVVLHVL